VAKAAEVLAPVRLAPTLKRDLPKLILVGGVFAVAFAVLEFGSSIGPAIFDRGGSSADWAYLSYKDPLLGLSTEEAVVEILPGQLTLGGLARLLKPSSGYDVDRTFYAAFMESSLLRGAVRGFQKTHDAKALAKALDRPEFKSLFFRFERDARFRARLARVSLAEEQEKRERAFETATRRDGSEANAAPESKRESVAAGARDAGRVIGAATEADGVYGTRASRAAPELQAANLVGSAAYETAADPAASGLAMRVLDAIAPAPVRRAREFSRSIPYAPPAPATCAALRCGIDSRCECASSGCACVYQAPPPTACIAEGETCSSGGGGPVCCGATTCQQIEINDYGSVAWVCK